MELVISSHSGGRIYDSSVTLDMHTYSLCTLTFVVASGEYLAASKLYGFNGSASRYDDDDVDSVLLKLHSLP